MCFERDGVYLIPLPQTLGQSFNRIWCLESAAMLKSVVYRKAQNPFTMLMWSRCSCLTSLTEPFKDARSNSGRILEVNLAELTNENASRYKDRSYSDYMGCKKKILK